VSIAEALEEPVATADDVFNEACGTRRVLSLLADKWTVLLVAALHPGPRRFGELQRRIEGISAKVLTDCLRGLEEDGLVVRTAFPTIPPKVEYALTPLGQSLVEPLTALCRWAAAHLEEVEVARSQFAARAQG
jgi:DNA-binding HxlR family transcriptional regulator